MTKKEDTTIHFERDCVPLETPAEYFGIKKFLIPILVQPKFFKRHKKPQGMIAEFIPDEKAVLFTVVWNNEHVPFTLISDKIYACYRKRKYGRVQDQQCFKVHYNSTLERPVGISSHNWTNYSKRKCGWCCSKGHNSHYFDLSNMEYMSHRPIIYVDSWYHGFSIRDGNVKKDKYVCKDLPLFKWKNLKNHGDPKSSL
uniref:Uncharacterized protein n=1 Tax=viral metagenome TaxID=1070528 RepID=A0A6C0CJE1_9ZZZZ